jgi:hypothetical protein
MAKGSSSPPVPNPADQVNAEAKANRYNVNSPFGSQTWSQGPDGQYTQSVSLNPSEQRQYDTHGQIAETLLGQSQDAIDKGLPGYSDLEANPGRPGSLQTPGAPTSFAPRSVNAAGDPGQFDLNSASSPAADAHYKRIAEQLTPSFKRQTDDWEQRMANQGLPIGSDAYTESQRGLMEGQDRTLADAAYQSAEIAPQLALQNRGQQMSDRGQLFGEATSGAQSDIAARQQQMQDRGQGFNEQLAAQTDARTGYQQYQNERARQFNEDTTRRQNYYNEIAAALGGEQLNPVNAGGGGGDGQLNVSGAYNAYNNANLAGYNAGQAGKNNMLSALAGLGSSWIQSSDERLKDNIEPIGELPSGDTLYEWTWKGDESGQKDIGVLAQEIEDVDPEAVTIDPATGYRKVDYKRVLARAMLAA